MPSISNLSSSNLQSIIQVAQQAGQATHQAGKAAAGAAKQSFAQAIKGATYNNPLSVSMDSLASGSHAAATASSAQVTSAATSNLLNMLV